MVEPNVVTMFVAEAEADDAGSENAFGHTHRQSCDTFRRRQIGDVGHRGDAHMFRPPCQGGVP